MFSKKILIFENYNENYIKLTEGRKENSLQERGREGRSRERTSSGVVKDFSP